VKGSRRAGTGGVRSGPAAPETLAAKGGYHGPRSAPLHPDGATHRPRLAQGMGGELGHVNPLPPHRSTPAILREALLGMWILPCPGGSFGTGAPKRLSI